jgi:hypothetical protein
LAGALAGLIFVNVLSKPEFALYTLAVSAAAFFAFAADLGSTGSLLYFYRHSRDRGLRFERYAQAVGSLRRDALVLSGGVVAAGLPLWLIDSGFSTRTALLTTGLVVVSVRYQNEAALSVVRLRLLGRFGLAYWTEIAGGLLRLALALALAVSGLRLGVLALATNACATGISALLCRRALPPAEHPQNESLTAERREILRYLTPTLPSAIHFAAQGPLLVWLAANFGGTGNVAEVGALGRIGTLLAVFSALTPTVFIVRLVRIEDATTYRRRFLQFGGALVGIGSGLVLTGLWAPGLLLWLLGGQYAGLREELVVALATAGVTLVAGYAVSVVASRSWLRLQPVATLALVCLQVALALMLRLDTTKGVLLFGLASAVAGLVAQGVFLTLGFLRPSIVYHSPDRSR